MAEKPSSNHAKKTKVLSSPAKDVEQTQAEIACQLCSKKKIKCDRLQPCSNCVKIQSQCVYRDRIPGGRKPKRHQPDGLEGYNAASDGFKSPKHGKRLSSPDNEAPGLDRQTRWSEIRAVRAKEVDNMDLTNISEQGRIMKEDGNFRYVEK